MSDADFLTSAAMAKGSITSPAYSAVVCCSPSKSKMAEVIADMGAATKRMVCAAILL
jgi:hypothetical protein